MSSYPEIRAAVTALEEGRRADAARLAQAAAERVEREAGDAQDRDLRLSYAAELRGYADILSGRPIPFPDDTQLEADRRKHAEVRARADRVLGRIRAAG